MSSKSTTSKPNHRIKCSYCNESFLIKAYSSHVIREHKIDIFKKDNLDELKRVVKNKHTRMPIEVTHRVLKGDDKVEFFVPCCNKFFSRDFMAMKHLKTNECRVCYHTNAEKLLNEISGITTSVVVDISGNNNTANTHTTTNNIVNNGTLIMDNSGNVVDLIALIKKLNITIDYLQYEKALNAKKKNKYKNKLVTINENTESDFSDVSDIESIYSEVNDDVSDKEVCFKRFDIQKKLKTFVKKEGLNVDLSKLSRDALNLRTGYEKAKEIKEKKEEAEREERERLEDEKAERKWKKQAKKDAIYHLKDIIERNQMIANDLLNNSDMSKPSNKVSYDTYLAMISKSQKELRDVQNGDSSGSESDNESE